MTKVRTIFHRCEGIPPQGLDEALAFEGYAEFCGGRVEASHLAFTLYRAGIGIAVRDDEDRYLATFADPAQAISHGFAQVDRSPAHPAARQEGECGAMTKTPRPDRSAVQYDPPGSFINALAAGAIVEMYDGPLNAPHLAFRMRSGGAAIHVVTPQGEIVGTFATAMAAAMYGFTRLDREAEERRATRSFDQLSRAPNPKLRRRTRAPDTS